MKKRKCNHPMKTRIQFYESTKTDTFFPVHGLSFRAFFWCSRCGAIELKPKNGRSVWRHPTDNQDRP